jgi:hypothetical protein
MVQSEVPVLRNVTYPLYMTVADEARSRSVSTTSMQHSPSCLLICTEPMAASMPYRNTARAFKLDMEGTDTTDMNRHHGNNGTFDGPRFISEFTRWILVDNERGPVSFMNV